MAIHNLCQAGAKVCALNGSRRLTPSKDFRNHRQPYDMPFHGFGDPKKRDKWIGYMDNEYTEGIWEHEIAFTTAPGTEWTWRRCFAVGGKTNFWGRSSARFSAIDFQAASRDGYDVDWPITYEEIAPYYSRVERMIGVASTRQNRPSNPDGEYLPPMNFRCIDRILESGSHKAGIPYLPDRIAQLTVPHAGHPACHYCGNCTEGCDVGAFFSTPWFFLPAAEKSGNLEIRTNVLAKNIIFDSDTGHAKGVAYIDRKTKQEVEVYAKAVVVAASCIESARILLNSKSRHWPDGIANSSGQAGRNLCDHMYGTIGRGYFPQLLGQPSFPDNVSSSTVAWLPRWQNLQNPREEKFIRGYSVYPDGGCSEFPYYYDQIDGFGHDFKREIKRRYPTPVSFYIQAPTQRSDKNFVDIDPTVKDVFGIPAARLHFEWDQNTRKMWDHGIDSIERLLHASGAEYLGHGPMDMPGTSLHETGTLRMGNDPKKFVTNRFGQTHDVPNLYVCDASVFPNCTDKTTTISILAFSLRTSEYLIENLKKA